MPRVLSVVDNGQRAVDSGGGTTGSSTEDSETSTVIEEDIFSSALSDLDIRRIAWGIEQVRRIMDATPIREQIVREVSPGAVSSDGPQLGDWVSDVIHCYYCICGYKSYLSCHFISSGMLVLYYIVLYSIIVIAIDTCITHILLLTICVFPILSYFISSSVFSADTTECIPSIQLDGQLVVGSIILLLRSC